MVAAAEALQHRHAPAAQDADLARLRPGVELELDLAVERRRRATVAPSAACVIVRSTGREEVVALAHEALVAA